MKAVFVAFLVLISCVPAWTTSPYDLFFRTEADAMLLGGGDVPGDITGRPELDRPTSLLTAGDGRLRLELCSQTPVALIEGDSMPGVWRSDAFKSTWAQTLGEDRRFALGMGHITVDDMVRYAEGGRGYRLDLREKTYGAGVAWRFDDAWTAGASASWGRVSGRAQGSMLADALDLPADTERWPTVQASTSSWVLGLSHQTGRWRMGASHGRSEPSAVLHLSRDQYDYTAPLNVSGYWHELWIAHDAGRECWWALARESENTGDGRVMLGLVGRGDITGEQSGRVRALGWRREAGRSLTAAQVDQLDGDLHLYMQGYAGLLPGISADVHTLRATGDVRTRSARVSRT